MRGNNNYKTEVQVLHPMENINSFQAFWSNSVGKKKRKRKKKRQKERARARESECTASHPVPTWRHQACPSKRVQWYSVSVHLGWLRHLFFVYDCLFVYIMSMPWTLRRAIRHHFAIVHGMCLHTTKISNIISPFPLFKVTLLCFFYILHACKRSAKF